MLRDLDQRQAGTAAPHAARGSGVAQGTVPVAVTSGAAPPASIQWRVASGAGLLLGLAAVGGYWYVQPIPVALIPAIAVVVPAPAASVAAQVTVAVLASAPARVVSTPALGLAPAAPPSTVEKTKVVTGSELMQTELPRQATKTAPTRAAVADPAADGQFLREDTAQSKVARATNLNAAQVLGGYSAPESLAHAQSMWNAGSRVAAIELLQRALSQVEASSAMATPQTGQSALAQLARELARMNLAEGQVLQALALLTRLEPQLSQIAEVWAMRGNAAQRAGQHSEAVNSYKQALQLHPDEPRWMLGEAVSLAAQGQLAAAGELAEKVRDFGALRPEIANYLRQLGVTVRMD
jgi:Flp pilus assembly protein TadD